jgi:hypothetical protein
VLADSDGVEPSPRPWRTIWFSPRRTVRALVEAETRPSWVPVVALAALHQGASGVLGNPAPDGTISISSAAMPAVLGVLQVIFGVLVGPFILAFTGGWFGGDADPDEIRQSVAWSYAPFAIATIVLLPMIVLSDSVPQGDLADAELMASQMIGALILLGAFLIYLAALAWTLVLQVVTLAEVQRFSIPRAIGSLVILLVPLLLLSAMV